VAFFFFFCLLGKGEIILLFRTERRSGAQHQLLPALSGEPEIGKSLLLLHALPAFCKGEMMLI